jgi:hypothetical protein
VTLEVGKVGAEENLFIFITGLTISKLFKLFLALPNRKTFQGFPNCV